MTSRKKGHARYLRLEQGEEFSTVARRGQQSYATNNYSHADNADLGAGDPDHAKPRLFPLLGNTPGEADAIAVADPL